MILIIHIVIALTSLALTALAFFIPTKLKLRLSGLFVGLTLASGTLLVLETNAPMLKACLSGLLYTGFVMATLISARLKLAKESV